MISENLFKAILVFLMLSIIGTLYYTRDLPSDNTEVVNTFDELVNSGHFPCSQLADELYGKDSRGTDIWCETASCEGEAMDYNFKNGNYYRVYDYHVDIHNDVVELYNEEGVLITEGKLSKLPKMILADNVD